MLCPRQKGRYWGGPFMNNSEKKPLSFPLTPGCKTYPYKTDAQEEKNGGFGTGVDPLASHSAVLVSKSLLLDPDPNCHPLY